MTGVTSQYELDLAELRASIASAKAALITAVRQAGISQVVMAYYGGDDISEIERSEAEDKDGKTIRLDRLPAGQLTDDQSVAATLEQMLQDFASDLLGLYHDGFEKNEGGFGEITFDVDAGTVTIDHTKRVVELVNSTTEL